MRFSILILLSLIISCSKAPTNLQGLWQFEDSNVTFKVDPDSMVYFYRNGKLDESFTSYEVNLERKVIVFKNSALNMRYLMKFLEISNGKIKLKETMSIKRIKD